MDRKQTEKWITYHSGLFTSFSDWLDSLDADARTATVDAIIGMFATTSLGAARAASMEIYRGDLKRPFYPEETAAIVLVASRKHERRQYTGGERSYNCGHCCDFGTVGVRARDGRTAWKACCCERGSKFRERRDYVEAARVAGGAVLTFDPDRDEAVSNLSPGPRSALCNASAAERVEARSIIQEAMAGIRDAREAQLAAADDSALGDRP